MTDPQPIQRDQVGDFYVRNAGGDSIIDQNPNGHYPGSPDTIGLIIRKTNAVATEDTLQILNSGQGKSINIISSGIGPLLYLDRTNSGAGNPALIIVNAGSGYDISAGNGNFLVDYEGNLTAKNGQFTNNVTATGDLFVNGDAILGNLNSNGNITIVGPANFGDSVSVGGNLSCTGSGTFNDIITFNGDVTFNSDVTFNGDIDGISGGLYIDAPDFGPQLKSVILEHTLEVAFFQVAIKYVKLPAAVASVESGFSLWDGAITPYTAGLGSDYFLEYRGLPVKDMRFADGQTMENYLISQGVLPGFQFAFPLCRIFGGVGGMPDTQSQNPGPVAGQAFTTNRIRWDLNINSGLLRVVWPTKMVQQVSYPPYFQPIYYNARCYLNFMVVLRKRIWGDGSGFLSAFNGPIGAGFVSASEEINATDIWNQGFELTGSPPEVPGGSF